MLVTKGEASGKYCPFKFSNNQIAQICTNEICMAWRESPMHDLKTNEKLGYCGLVGDPRKN